MMNDQHRTDPLWKALQATPEGRILVLGLALSLLGLMGLALVWKVNPRFGQQALGLIATNVLLGYAAGLSFGYAANFNHSLVLSVNFFTDVLLVLLFYPLFVFTLQHVLNWRALQAWVNRVQAAAAKREEAVQKYGAIGVFLFVFSPFWLTGPVVGCVLGYIIGLKPWHTIAVVLSGTALAVATWGLFLENLTERLVRFNALAPAALLGVVALLVIFGRKIHRRR